MRPCPGCEAGEQYCEDGAWGECFGQPEYCDGRDNDCDGFADEDYPLGEYCERDFGACSSDGVFACDEFGELVCNAPEPEGDFEVCNGEDDDCDGETDEDFPVGEYCDAGIGACSSDGYLRCFDDFELVCEPELERIEPVNEMCNGRDDDCDGDTDEDFPVGVFCEVGVGECYREGNLECDEFGEVSCNVDAGAESPERCNGADDDCDGFFDEDFDVGGGCISGVGRCARDGLFVCGEEGPVCDAAPGEPVAEQCNDLDDDCDGQVDEVEECGEEPPRFGDVRLRGGDGRNDGAVELWVDPGWAAFCFDGWGVNESATVCAQLGYPPPVNEPRAVAPPAGGPFLVSMDCNPNMNEVEQCFLNVADGCNQAVAITCGNDGDPGPDPIPVLLLLLSA